MYLKNEVCEYQTGYFFLRVIYNIHTCIVKYKWYAKLSYVTQEWHKLKHLCTWNTTKYTTDKAYLNIDKLLDIKVVIINISLLQQYCDLKS
jgi:hypothetical protein